MDQINNENDRDQLLINNLIINHLRTNRNIKGFYNFNDAHFSFWYAVYILDYFKNHQTYPVNISKFKNLLFDFYDIKDDETKKKNKIKNNKGKFIDNYRGFDFKNDINKFCEMYLIGINIYTYNPFEYPQFKQIGEINPRKSPNKLNLLAIYGEEIQFFAITNVDNLNGRLITQEIADDLYLNGKLTQQELKYKPFKDVYNIQLYEENLKKLRINMGLY